MSIRMLAVEFYGAKRRVEELAKELAALAPGSAGRPELESQLRQAQVEESRLKAMLDGAIA